MRSRLNGFISVFMFFLDVYSDVKVIMLLWTTGNYVWAYLALSCLIAQYVVVYFRVLPYLNKTFGANSCLTWSFTYLGLPVGLVILDALMLLEPFGLLTVLPLPAWLKQFVPACALTGLRSHSSTSAFRSLIPPFFYSCPVPHPLLLPMLHSPGRQSYTCDHGDCH